MYIFSNSSTNPLWQFDMSKQSTCHPAPTIVEDSSIIERNIILKNLGNQNITINFKISSLDKKLLNP